MEIVPACEHQYSVHTLTRKKWLVISFQSLVSKLTFPQKKKNIKNHHSTPERYRDHFWNKRTCFSRALNTWFGNEKTLHSSPCSKEWFIHVFQIELFLSLSNGLHFGIYKSFKCVILKTGGWKLLPQLETMKTVESFLFSFKKEKGLC